MPACVVVALSQPSIYTPNVKTESRCTQCWALFISKDEEEDLDDRNHNGKGSNMVVTCNADGLRDKTKCFCNSVAVLIGT
uniref:Uncharacterized protein n=1 Tax=Triticum urartu TaxID=4572 RepID=A0A8R7PX38_TRIUA